MCGPDVRLHRTSGHKWECGRSKQLRDVRNAVHRENLRVLALYNVTKEELKRIEHFQRSHEVYKLLLGKRLSTDHDHATGHIRGRLDWRLNQAYGDFERRAPAPDDFDRLMDALKQYHRYPPADIVLGGKRYGLIGQAIRKKHPLYGPPPGHKEPQRREVIQ